MYRQDGVCAQVYRREQRERSGQEGEAGQGAEGVLFLFLFVPIIMSDFKAVNDSYEAVPRLTPER